MSVIELASVCTFDCPDTCSLSVTVEDGRITKVRGSEAAPFTAGVICNKVARDMTAFVHGPQRILHPLRRTGPKGSGTFARVTWDAALDEIHARTSAVIERWGAQAVSPLNYAGPHGMLAGDSMSSRFFHKLGATQLYRRSMCGGVRSEAWAGTYGAVPGCPPELAAGAKLNVVWGNNATVTNLHLVRRIASEPEDGRYQALRREWAGKNVNLRFLFFFELQAVLDVVLSLPMLLVAMNPAPQLSWLEYAGAALWLVAVIGESLADAQLAAFKRDARNRGRVCQAGLWRYSRHPNYFFEWFVWVAWLVYALASPWGWTSVICPALMLFFLFRVTGIPATEAQALRSRGEEYRRYQETTSAFVPWGRKVASD